VRTVENCFSSFATFSTCPTLQLGKEGKLKLGSVRHFVLDECDKMLDKLGAQLSVSRVLVVSAYLVVFIHADTLPVHVDVGSSAFAEGD
jgi:hypothetical protein